MNLFQKKNPKKAKNEHFWQILGAEIFVGLRASHDKNIQLTSPASGTILRGVHDFFWPSWTVGSRPPPPKGFREPLIVVQKPGFNYRADLQCFTSPQPVK